ncbi:PH domain-containing protein [Bifidobacterium tissieri]|uniref:PH domain-containing protein n=1 Tax=Bifidobacterium tissieri TaxID=1630162 RepID=A0A5N0A100_9BIFI|nr:PH domain-containing protein [Bifidobacterium tissieri]KAA8830800.1 PH domain-containing protein [Bifidobacterium tissieri]KAA8832812.1 PH domain-containing protein [Bifidobacterium tissieri]
MIDFNTTFTKMGDMGHGEANTLLDGLLLDGETVHAAFTGTRGWVAFTDRRVIIVTAQGITGKKKDYTTLPYSGIRAASVDTTNGFDADANMELRIGDLGFSGLVGTATPCKIRLEFVPGVDVRDLERFVVDRIL